MYRTSRVVRACCILSYSLAPMPVVSASYTNVFFSDHSVATAVLQVATLELVIFVLIQFFFLAKRSAIGHD